jgi:phosphatidylserine/phosphatidylglycerophosphate/cardiolipin synthase-like enzyme
MIQIQYANPADVSNLDIATINAAQKTVDMAAYSLTHPLVIKALETKADAGVQIRLYLDRTELEATARGDATVSKSPLGALLAHKNVTVKVKKSSILMHLKAYLVDGITLREGSTNYSPVGESEQDNSLILTDDAACVAAFKTKFEAMWARPNNISPAQAILTLGHGHSSGRRSH